VLAGELFGAVEICPSDPDIAYAVSYRAVHRSDDGGRTWVRMNREDGTWGSPGLVAGLPIDVQCDPDDPMRVEVNNYLGGNFLSRDGGQTWLSASKGYTGALIRQVAVSPDRGATVFSGSRSGVFRSEDGGGRWVGTQYIPPELIMPEAPVKLTEMFALAVDPSDPDHLIASSQETPGFLVTDDGGRSWELVQYPAGVLPPITLTFSPADAQVVFAGSADYYTCKDRFAANPGECVSPDSGFSLSEDSGETWLRPPESALDGQAVMTVEAHPEDANIVFAGTHSLGLMRSADRGVTWEQIGDGLPSLPVLDVAIHPRNPDLVFAGTQGAAVYKSTDGGENFAQASAGLEPNAYIFSLVVDETDEQVVYAADERSGVSVSTDSGASWQAINQGLEHRAVRSLALSSDGSVLYAGVKGGGVWRLGDVPNQVADNDTCVQAIELDAGTHSEQFSFAGTDGAASCDPSPGADLWYRHTVSADGVLHVNTCGSHDVAGADAGVDTVVSVHRGCPGTEQNELPGGCSDDWTTGSDPLVCGALDAGQAGDGAVAVAVNAGDELWIRVGRHGPVNQGEFWLTVALDESPGLPAPRRPERRVVP
jgi:photosystem II stability/assembly factor-like uncharacterized protein